MAKHNRKPFSFIFYIVLCLSALHPGLARSQTASSPELLEAQARLLEAETRQALAEAERAELLARLPPPRPRH